MASHTQRKIALVLIGVTIGGLERRMLRLVEHLSRSPETKDRFVFFVSQTIYDFCQREKIATLDLPVHVIPLKGSRLTLAHALRVVRAIWKERKNLSSVVTFESGFEIGWIIPPGLSLYCFVVNAEPFFDMARWRVFNLFIRMTFRRAKRIDAITPYRKEYLLKTTSIPAERITVSPCSFIRPVARVDFQAKKPWIAWAGRLVASKQPLLFIEALKLLNDAGKLNNYSAKIYGYGPQANEVQTALQSYGLTDVAGLLYEERLAEALAQSRLFVTTADNSNYGNQTLFEAMSAGCAVLATDVGDTSILVDDEVGLRVPNAAKDLADGLSKMLQTTDDQWLSWGQTARQRVAIHNIENYTKHFLKVIEF